jgi:hypothetical protein
MRITKEQKAQQLAYERGRAYRHVKDVAVFLLTMGSPFAFEIIWKTFKEYEKAVKKAERYVLKNFPDSYSLMYVLMEKTITDAYWDLTDQQKLLWDGVPELKAWREKYW